jgi:hypothetical protein
VIKFFTSTKRWMTLGYLFSPGIGPRKPTTYDELAFNPWNTTDEFRPLGNLNRARKVAYDASAAHRLAYRFRSEVPLRNRVLGAAARSAFSIINRRIEWHKLSLRGLPQLLSSFCAPVLM